MCGDPVCPGRRGFHHPGPLPGGLKGLGSESAEAQVLARSIHCLVVQESHEASEVRLMGQASEGAGGTLPGAAHDTGHRRDLKEKAGQQWQSLRG